MAEQYDPSNYTVDEVNDYLKSDTTTDEERARVLQAERDGQARKGILGDEATSTEGDATTVTESGAPEAVGEAYQKGYHGFVPSRDGDNPEDLTLQGVLKGQG